MNNSQSVASLLIDALQQKERALLYTALQLLKSQAETSYAEHVTENEMAPTLALRVTECYRWHIQESKDLINKLFAECFPEDMELLKYFDREFPITTKEVFVEKTYMQHTVSY